MAILRFPLALAVCAWATTAAAELTPAMPAEPPTTVLEAARLLDVDSGKLVAGGRVVVRGDQIVAVGDHLTVPPRAKVIDLGDVTLLPGLIDCHTHLMARFGEGPDAYTLDLATKSQAYRALEGAANARATLRAGFTTVRDVESEGSGYADVALRDAIRHGLVEGPRMFVATRGIAAVGAYNPFGVSPDLRDFPTGAQMVSGVEEARRAVREQLGHGADLIKVYADWEQPTLSREELRVVVEEAHRQGKKVAAHADSPAGIQNALDAGVDSIEHAMMGERASIELMKKKGVTWVPTRAGFHNLIDRLDNPEEKAFFAAVVERGKVNLALARKLGLPIAAGFDASEARDQGHNAEEIIELGRLGLPPLEALRAATTRAAALLGIAKLGSLAPGKLADVVAVAGNPLADLNVLRDVRFVMKGGTIVRSDGN